MNSNTYRCIGSFFRRHPSLNQNQMTKYLTFLLSYFPTYVLYFIHAYFEQNDRKLQQVAKKIVPLIVDKNKGREIFYRNFIDRLHPQFWELDQFHMGDALFTQTRGRASDGPQIKTAELLA